MCFRKWLLAKPISFRLIFLARAYKISANENLTLFTKHKNLRYHVRKYASVL